MFALADPGGGAAGAPPQQDPILLFSHMFLPKSAHIGGQRPPPQRFGVPQWEILDPLLGHFGIAKK